MSRTYVDDNFGTWDMQSEEDIEFYHHMQQVSVEKECDACGRTVKLHPDYAICDSCCDKLERGMDIYG